MPERKNFILRIDPALWSEIERWAQEELRSVNGQIEYLLKQAVIVRGRKLREEAAEASSPKSPGSAPD